MVGVTLAGLRRRIEGLADEGGRFRVVCGRTGRRPVPVDGRRFATRAAARAGADAAGRYRRTLRRYDPRLPTHDLIVQEAPTADGSGSDVALPAEDRPAADAAGRDGPSIEFCHGVAAATFEALSAAGHDDVERAVFDRYLALAERVDDHDELCLRLLSGLAVETAAALDPAEGARLLAAAADRLDAVADRRPVAGALGRLRRHGLVESAARSPGTVDLDAGTRSVVVSLSGYALSARDGRLPVLPLVVELYRREPDRSPSTVRVDPDGDGWRLTLVLADEPEPAGLVAAPVGGGT